MMDCRTLFLITLIAIPFQDIFGQAGTCFPATSQTDLDINNVRAKLLNGGDMWWDHNSAHYEVPKDSGTMAFFASSIVIGGKNSAGDIKLAAMRYRSIGNDFWPGPLSSPSAMVTDTTCLNYDRHYKINRYEVEEFILKREMEGYQMPEVIKNWPAHGNVALGQAKNLAPFRDVDSDGIYNPYKGDHPEFDLRNTMDCNDKLLGDQCVWWVINDAGGLHSETGGEPIGIEVQCMAYAYATEDAINDATFYRYKLINRSNETLYDTWFGNWVDADLGCYNDDYVGCDVERGMGYVYNGDSLDVDCQGAKGYGLHPPAAGLDYLQGPLADAGDGIDNDRDFSIDEGGEEIPMARFLHSGGGWFEPTLADDYYNVLQGRDNLGNKLKYNGNQNYPCDFMYPGTSDTIHWWGTGGVDAGGPWSEITSGNTPADRKFIQSVGPFTFQPGEVKTITLGVLWAQDPNGNNFDAITALQAASDKAQALYDNCFDMGCVPPKPEMRYKTNRLIADFAYPFKAENYEWDFGDGFSGTGKYPRHVYGQAGTYTVCLTVSSACGIASVCEEITIDDGAHHLFKGPELKRIEGRGTGGWELELTDSTVEAILASEEHRILHPVYTPSKAPVQVLVAYTQALVKGKYILQFEGLDSLAGWKMYLEGQMDTVYSESTIEQGGYQLISKWGLMVCTQPTPPIPDVPRKGYTYLSAELTYKDTSKQWLAGVSDKDLPSAINWIRSGRLDDPNNAIVNDYKGFDDNEEYEHILNGTWAPFQLTSNNTHGPMHTGNTLARNLNKMEYTPSVQVVLTPDKSKWSRCPVVEMQEDNALAQGNPAPNCASGAVGFLRDAPSVDKYGNKSTAQDSSTNPSDANFISPTGMGWFPGYAIDLGTGERLNIAFGEDSWLVNENGADMLWNPTENDFEGPLNDVRFGGKHYIFVFRNNIVEWEKVGGLGDSAFIVPHYDHGKFIHDQLAGITNAASVNPEAGFRNVYRSAVWVGLPLLSKGYELLETEVKINLQMEKPYGRYVNNGADTINGGYPMYEFYIDPDDYLVSEIYPGKVFPNPFWEEAFFHFPNSEDGPFEFYLYNSQGKLIANKKELTGETFTFSRAGLQTGVYIYLIVNRFGAVTMKGKIVAINTSND